MLTLVKSVRLTVDALMGESFASDTSRQETMEFNVRSLAGERRLCAESMDCNGYYGHQRGKVE